MKWLTLENIKKHLRLEQDFTDEDELLEMYGASAEDTVLNMLNRTKENIEECYGKIPVPLVQASLLLVEQSYTQRGVTSAQKQYEITYGFDTLIKPYMHLT